MALVNFTTFPEVRAALGVNTTELPDGVLALPMYATKLREDFDDITPNDPGALVLLYTTVSQIAEGSRTNVERKLYDVSRLFATYAVAKHLVISLPLFSLRTINDGRAESERSNNYYEKLRDDLDETLVALRWRLAAIYATLTPPSVAITRTVQVMTLASPAGFDPVTNV